MGAAAGVIHLRSLGLNVVAVSGRITRSPLGMREAESVLGLPMLGLAELADPTITSTTIGLQLELIAKQDPAQMIPWPSTEPEWEMGGLADDDVVLSEEETVMQMVDPR
jgi:hypothetical protein